MQARPADEPIDANKTQEDFQKFVMKTLQVLMEKVDRIESQMLATSAVVHKQLNVRTSPVSDHSPKDTTSSPDTFPTPQYAYELRLVNVKDTWYTERPYPSFHVQVIDVRTGEIAKEANQWSLTVDVFDGFGRSANNKLADDRFRNQTLVNGTCEVTGLRFRQVSSKNGSFFQIACEVTGPPQAVSLLPKVQSGHVTILSSRLFACRKGSFSKLTGEDSIGQLPGIGRQYESRLEKLGIRTIGDLAELPVDESNQPIVQHILESIRKDKGTLTEQRLIEYVHVARAVVNGEFASELNSPADSNRLTPLIPPNAKWPRSPRQLPSLPVGTVPCKRMSPNAVTSPPKRIKTLNGEDEACLAVELGGWPSVTDPVAIYDCFHTRSTSLNSQDELV